MPSLWTTHESSRWREALDTYETVIERQGSDRLAELDRWYRTELPAAIASRREPHVTLDEMVMLTKWKMTRGKWRARNLSLVQGNEAEEVVRASMEALRGVPDATAPISRLAKLSGVGPATASAVMAAAAPEVYPFLDDVAAEQVPGLGPVKYTLGYYRDYSEALLGKAEIVGRSWTPVMIERALWAAAGGKAE